MVVDVVKPCCFGMREEQSTECLPAKHFVPGLRKHGQATGSDPTESGPLWTSEPCRGGHGKPISAPDAEGV